MKKYFLALMIFAASATISEAQYQVFYLDSIAEGELIAYCSNSDSLKFIPPKDHDPQFIWRLHNDQGLEDTVWLDTLILQNGRQLNISYQSDPFKSFSITPFSVQVKTRDYNIVCGTDVQLEAVVNDPEDDNCTFLWTPSAGLDDPNIPNPTAIVSKFTVFNVQATSSRGCKAKDSTIISVDPVTVDIGEDQIIICGQEVQLQVTSDYTGSETPTYTWTPATGLDDPSSDSPKAMISTTTRYKVEFTTGLGCFSSDSITLYLAPKDPPSICIVTVDSTNKNVVVWESVSDEAVDSIYIFKETDVTDVFEEIGRVSRKDPGLFRDENSYPDIQSNRYRLALVDTCGFVSGQGASHKTMHLSINQGQGSTWNLIWEPYEGINVSTYRIYRGTSPHNLELIGTTTGSSTQYSDFSAPEGYIYYQVEVISPHACVVEENTDKSFLITYNSSRSNIATNNPSGIFTLQVRPETVKLFPNPVHSYLHIENNGNFHTGARVTILTPTGSVLKKAQYHEGNITIPVNDLAAGYYILRIETTKKSYIGHFLKY